jgi:hypothetical protein
MRREREERERRLEVMIRERREERDDVGERR